MGVGQGASSCRGSRCTASQARVISHTVGEQADAQGCDVRGRPSENSRPYSDPEPECEPILPALASMPASPSIPRVTHHPRYRSAPIESNTASGGASGSREIVGTTASMPASMTAKLPASPRQDTTVDHR